MTVRCSSSSSSSVSSHRLHISCPRSSESSSDHNLLEGLPRVIPDLVLCAVEGRLTIVADDPLPVAVAPDVLQIGPVLVDGVPVVPEVQGAVPSFHQPSLQVLLGILPPDHSGLSGGGWEEPEGGLGEVAMEEVVVGGYGRLKG
jgi:hypothetical protein